MKAQAVKASTMRMPTLREIGNEAKLLLIGIPVLIWTLIPIYHMFLFAISPKQDAFAGKLWPDHPTLQNFASSSTSSTIFCATSGFSSAIRW